MRVQLMNAPTETDQSPETDENWVQVGHYPTLEQAYDHGLVILAMGEACRVEPAAGFGEFELHAESLPADRISSELDAYGREIALSVEKPAVLSDWARHPAGAWLCGIWIATLIAVFYWQGEDSSLAGRAASSSVGLIERGEWWRPFTGLFLHANVPHLAGNLVIGTVFGTLVARSVGALKGWALILACGTLGNALTSRLTYPESFVSLGASTAVFAALGILAGMGVLETLRSRARLPWAKIAAPVLGGVILLGLLGGGHDPRTDVLGHVFGFGSGLMAGMAAGALEEKISARS